MSNYLHVNCLAVNSKNLQKIVAYFGFVLVLQEKPIKAASVERLFGTIEQKNLEMAHLMSSIASLNDRPKASSNITPGKQQLDS